MKDRSVLVGSLVAGLLASACCIGPLILGAVGLGSLGLAAALAPYRPWFLGLTAVLLGVGFFFAYTPGPAAACTEGGCPVPASRRNPRIVLWLVAALTVGLATYPHWGAAAASLARNTAGRSVADRSAMPAASGPYEVVTLDVSGMTCSACAGEIQAKLDQVPGVAGVDVSFKESRATVRLGTPAPSMKALVSAVEAAGYHAKPTGQSN
jgi:mercuric ion transport protein